MSLNQFLDNAMSEWMRVKGAESDVIFSSRVRIARNLSHMPFPMLSTASQSEEVIHLIEDALMKEDIPEILENAELIHMADLTDLQKRVLVEKHLISPHLAEESTSGAVLFSQDESVSIMVNEEDHVRIQCLFPGFQLEKAWQLASQITICNIAV